MSPDDPRHGTIAGYIAHGRTRTPTCDPCRRAKMRYEKARLVTGPRKVSALGTQRRLQALRALGWSLDDIAVACGYTGGGAFRYLLKSDTVTRATAAKVAAVYEQLALTTPTSHRAPFCRRHAARQGWPPPLAWDDIDNPDEQPTDWHYQPGDRGDLLEELDAQKVGISEVCRVLGLRRDTVEKWCERHGYTALFSRLVAREITNPASPFTGNQHQKVS